jgi:hypothetical protein
MFALPRIFVRITSRRSDIWTLETETWVGPLRLLFRGELPWGCGVDGYETLWVYADKPDPMKQWESFK